MDILNADQLGDWYQERQRINQMRARLSSETFDLESEVGDEHGDWRVNPDSPRVLSRGDGRFFTVDRVDVSLGKFGWPQPMIVERDQQEWSSDQESPVPVTGLIVCVRTNVEDTVAHLVHAKQEPGAIHEQHLLLTHAVQASFSNALSNPGKVPMWDKLAIPIGEEFEQDESLDAFVVPQDAGRFHGKHNLFIRRKLTAEEAETLELPDSHVWATREAIRTMQRKGVGSDFLAQGFGL